MIPSYLKSLLAPPLCTACGSLFNGAGELCRPCERALQPLPPGHCERCAEPFAAENLSPHLCGACVRRFPPYRKVWASLLYRGPVPGLLHGVKFGKNPLGFTGVLSHAAPGFARAMGEFRPEEILPMPISFWRRLRRGFNQSFLLAHDLVKNSPHRVPIRRWVRRKHAPSQARQSKRDRARSLKGVFSIPRPEKVLGKRILIVDDVMTTGATVEALSRCLLQAGAQEVGVYVLARTPKH